MDINNVQQRQILTPLCHQQSLHLQHIHDPTQPSKGTVFFLHGVIENGRIFYSKKNKGLAPFLASQGYDCYVADLRGRGESKPAINALSNYGQTEAIKEDIPHFLEKIKQLTGSYPDYWIGHSWGGVLLNSYLARNPNMIESIKACAYFGTKRSLFNRHPSRFFQANILWYFLAPKLSKKHGYLPAKKLKWGSDSETRKSLRQSIEWAKPSSWVDSDDHFDYAAALKEAYLPPTLHIAGVKDKALAQPIDIKEFMKESGKGIQKISVYGQKHGHKHNYGHIDMLTHKHAQHDQFQDVISWFEQH